MDSKNADAWTAYWREGRIASCFDGTGTEVRLSHVWHEFVDRLPNGSSVLDLATGNGAVAYTCAARAAERSMNLHFEAIDSAEIDPRVNVRVPQHLLLHVRFRGGIRLENLPYDDRLFNGVTSQFGFEYADEGPAALEAARVLAPGGHLRLVVHAFDGAVSRIISKRVRRLRSVLVDRGAVSLVRDLVRAADAGDAATIESKSRLLAAANAQVRELAVNPPPEDSALFYARELLQLWARRDRFWPSDLRRSVEQAWDNANGVAVRQEQMLQAARSMGDMRRISDRLATAGLVVDPIVEVREEHQGSQIAWLLDAHKPTNASTE